MTFKVKVMVLGTANLVLQGWFLHCTSNLKPFPLTIPTTESCRTCLTNHMESIPHQHITLLVINSLGVGTHILTSQTKAV